MLGWSGGRGRGEAGQRRRVGGGTLTEDRAWEERQGVRGQSQLRASDCPRPLRSREVCSAGAGGRASKGLPGGVWLHSPQSCAPGWLCGL